MPQNKSNIEIIHFAISTMRLFLSIVILTMLYTLQGELNRSRKKASKNNMGKS